MYIGIEDYSQPARLQHILLSRQYMYKQRMCACKQKLIDYYSWIITFLCVYHWRWFTHRHLVLGTSYKIVRFLPYQWCKLLL